MKSTLKHLRKIVKQKIKELGEQETEKPAATPSEPTSPTTSNATKWESGVKRGKANPIDDKIKWESGLTRGKANPIDDKKKWESGVVRGKANPIN